MEKDEPAGRWEGSAVRLKPVSNAKRPFRPTAAFLSVKRRWRCDTKFSHEKEKESTQSLIWIESSWWRAVGVSVSLLKVVTETEQTHAADLKPLIEVVTLQLTGSASRSLPGNIPQILFASEKPPTPLESEWESFDVFHFTKILNLIFSIGRNNLFYFLQER